MLLDLIAYYWVLKPIAEDIDRYSYEHEVMLLEIENLKEEIRFLKNKSSFSK